MSTNTGEGQYVENPWVTRVYNAKDLNDCRDVYDEWAETYDEHLTSPEEEYVAPTLVAETAKSIYGNLDGPEIVVLDAGCGTGLSGVALAAVGAKTIDGADYSSGMLGVARKKGVYRHLELADLTQEVPQYKDESYDVVTCVGTLTQGHVGPVPALREFVRMLRTGGVLVATVLESIWESGGFDQEVEALKDGGKVEVVSTQKAAHYRKAAGVQAILLVLRKS